MFDPNQFINATVSAPMSTVIPVCPEGEYVGYVSDEGELSDWFREIKWQDKKDGSDKTATGLEIPVKITDPKALAPTNRTGPFIVRIKSFLDIDNQGNLDTGEGKNVKLGQLRNAVGQNKAGEHWQFAMLRGAGPAVFKVVHVLDKKDPSIKYAEVSKILKVVS